MPLRGIVNGQSLIACQVSKEEWHSLKASKDKEIKMPCCFGRGIMKTSKLGTQYFAHYRKDSFRDKCNAKRESIEHLELKAEILQICQKLGWQGDVEVSGDGWRADILVHNQELDSLRQVIFEVQLSSQSLEETKRRQEKYQNEGYECVWLFNSLPTNSDIYADIPMFKIQPKSYQVLVEDKDEHKITKIPLEEFIEIWLTKKIKYCSHRQLTTSDELEILFSSQTCPNCLTKNNTYTVYGKDSKSNVLFKSGCELLSSESPKEMAIEFIPEVINYIKKYVKNHRNWKTILANIKYDDENKEYNFYCCKCNKSIFLPKYPFIKKDDFLIPLKTDFVILREKAHWCYSKEQNFCDTKISKLPKEIIWKEEIGEHYASLIDLLKESDV